MDFCDSKPTDDLPMDTGQLLISAANSYKTDKNLTIFAQATECYKVLLNLHFQIFFSPKNFQCPLVPICMVNCQSDSGYFLQVNTSFPTKLELKLNGETETFCSFLKHFGEYGEYNLTILGNNSCKLIETKAPINSFLRNFS